MSADAIKLLKPKVFDKSRWMQLPRDVVIGHDVFGQIPSVCEDLKLGTSALLISGKGTMVLAGNKVLDILSKNYSVKPFIAEEISVPVIKKAQKAAAGMDFIVGIGGGRVIDTAKIVSYNLDIQFISIPTAASHDGIASSRASVPTVEGHASLDAQPPIAIIADTGIIASAPHRLLAAGCADIISNYTAILDWELAHRVKGEPMSEYAVALSKMTAEILVKNAHLIKPHQEQSAWFVTKVSRIQRSSDEHQPARPARQAEVNISFPMHLTSLPPVRHSMARAVVSGQLFPCTCTGGTGGESVPR